MSDENIFKGVNTICTHVGQVKDEQYGGSVSPIYPGTSYEYIDKEIDNEFYYLFSAFNNFKKYTKDKTIKKDYNIYWDLLKKNREKSQNY